MRINLQYLPYSKISRGNNCRMIEIGTFVPLFWEDSVHGLTKIAVNLQW